MALAPVEFRSLLTRRPEELWERVTSLEGINEECLPWMQLTAPAGLRSLADSGERRVGEVWGRVGLWLLRMVPLGAMHLRLTMLVSEAPERCFVEESRIWLFASWRHERRVVSQGDASLLFDRVDLAPRLPGTGWLLRAFVWFLFEHRHRRLRARQGGRSL